MQTQIRLLLKEQSDLGVHCLPMLFCQQLYCTKFWDIYRNLSLYFSFFSVPPSIDTVNASPSNSTVIKNNPLYLDCPVTGIPRPKVFWYKDGEIVSPDLDPNLRLLAEGRRLEIIGARVTDAGSYKCVGENVAGKTEIDFEVGVHGNISVNTSLSFLKKLAIFSALYSM